MRIVRLKYNPYIPRLSITIDDKPISEYSSLAQYTDEDIWKWKDNILDNIYSEIREEFKIVFVGRTFDADVIRSLSDNYEYCVGFSCENPIISETVQKRLVQLNKFIKNNNVNMFSKTIIKAYFVIDAALTRYNEDIEGIDIKNNFCSVKISTTIDRKEISDDNSYIFVISTDTKSGLNVAEIYKSRNPIFVVAVGEQSGFDSIHNKILVFLSERNNLLNTIFDCFLNYPLIIPIRNCVKSLPDAYRNKTEVRKIHSIDPVIIVDVNNLVEIGRSNKIGITCEPSVHNQPQIIFKTLNSEIVSCEGRYIYGKSTGKTILEAYIPGEAKPFETIEIQSIKRNRIKKLLLDEDNLILGEGTSSKLRFEYVPADADNLDCIAWKSSDESIVSVDTQGRIKCNKPGKCRIICTAENISAQCMCTVKPYLKDIIIEQPALENNTFIMAAMEEQVVKIKTFPEDCIDGKFTITSSNYDVVNYVNGKLIAKNKGSAEITIANQSKSKSLIIHIKVRGKLSGIFKRK